MRQFIKMDIFRKIKNYNIKNIENIKTCDKKTKKNCKSSFQKTFQKSLKKDDKNEKNPDENIDMNDLDYSDRFWDMN